MEQSVRRSKRISDQVNSHLAVVAGFFAFLIAVSMLWAGESPPRGAEPILNCAIMTILLLGWTTPIAFVMVCAYFLSHVTARLLRARGNEPGDKIREVMQASIIALGSLILALTIWIGSLVFGLWRMGGDPSVEAMAITLALLAGGAGLLLLQRWGGLLACGDGWWSLARLLWIKATVPTTGEEFFQRSLHTGLWLSALVIPLTAAFAASWCYLKGGPKLIAPYDNAQVRPAQD